MSENHQVLIIAKRVYPCLFNDPTFPILFSMLNELFCLTFVPFSKTKPDFWQGTYANCDDYRDDTNTWEESVDQHSQQAAHEDHWNDQRHIVVIYDRLSIEGPPHLVNRTSTRGAQNAGKNHDRGIFG